MIAAAIGLWFWPSGEAPQGTWLAEAVAAHRAWLDRGSSQERSDRIQVALEARQIAGIPDLSDARLSLVHVSLSIKEGHTQGLLLGYLGVHGCRVGLWIGEGPADLEEQMIEVESGEVAGYAWRSGETAYTILARGMDPKRLKLLADAVVRATKDGGHTDEQVRTALRQTAETGTPCAA